MRKLRASVLLLPLLLLIEVNQVKADLYVFKSPGSNAGSWIDPTNAYGDELPGSEKYAYSTTDGSQHKYGGYGFNIPSTATIIRVIIRVDAWCKTNDKIKLEVSVDGGVNFLTTSWISDLTTWQIQYWVEVTSWTTWTADKISDDKIWTRVTHVSVGTTDEVCLDYIPISVAYKLPYKLPTTITVDTNPRTVNKIGNEITKIFGHLTSDGTGVAGKTVRLYYRYASTDYGTPPDETWTHIGDVPYWLAGAGGYYEYYWDPDDTLANGYYWIKAVFEGDSDYLASSATTGVNTIPNLFVVPEVPLGTLAALASMMLAFAAVMLHKRPRPPLT